MQKLLTLLLVCLALLGSAALAEDAPVVVDRIAQPELSFSFPEDAELMRIVFPNVWDEDAEVILCGGKALLIDCAKEHHGNRVTALLRQLGVTELDCIINTHPHNDHLLGLQTIAAAVPIKELFFCFPDNETEHMAVALATAKKYNIPVRRYADGDQFSLGGAVIDVWLKGDEDWSLNERSAQMRVQFGERTMLFTADMLQKTQRRLMEVIDPALLDVDILKYPHHGLSLPDDDFFAMVSPAYVIITNTAGDRTAKVRKYLNQRGTPWAVTVPGYVSLTTDGQTWLIERIPMDTE